MNIRLIVHALLGCWLLIAGSVRADHGEQDYTLGVVPQIPTFVIQQHWTPVLDELHRRSGIKLALKTYKSIPEFEQALLRGELDFAYMNPYHAVMARNAQGYRPLIRDGARQLEGILVVNLQSPYHDVKQLAGQTIGFPSPNAFAASLYMRALLERQHGIVIEPTYVKTHSNVYRNVLYGEVAAGGGVNKTLSSENMGVRENLRILYKTPPVAPHPLCFHPRVNKQAAALVQEKILEMGRDENASALLKRIHLSQPIESNFKRDYAPLIKLKLEKYMDKP